MFETGFEKQIFSQRHPNLGLSFSDLQNTWKNIYPQVKADLKPFADRQVPLYPAGTMVPQRTNLVTGGPSTPTVLAIGALALLGAGAVYAMTAKRPFSFLKK